MLLLPLDIIPHQALKKTVEMLHAKAKVDFECAKFKVAILLKTDQL